MPEYSNYLEGLTPVVGALSGDEIIGASKDGEAVSLTPQQIADLAEGGPNGLASVDTTGTAIAFAIPQIYGSSGTPETGNITLVTTGLVKGMVQILYHDNGTEPTYPAEFVKLSGSYSTTVLNIIYMCAISATRIEYVIKQEA